MADDFDMRGINQALKRLYGLRKETSKELCHRAAKGFVRRVVQLTPPASAGVNGSAAKKAGEAVIQADAARIFSSLPAGALDAYEQTFSGGEQRQQFGHKGAKALGDVKARVLRSIDEMRQWHKDRRNKDGRVMNIHRDVTTGLKKKDLIGLDIGLVTKQMLLQFVKLLQADVGKLAAGWNESAERLGVRLPAWVKRHGNKHGEYHVFEKENEFKLVLSNTVPFVDNVKGYNGRIKKALKFQENAMNREADALLKRAIKKAGF